MSGAEWPFDQPRNCAVIVSRSVAFDGAAILLVSHDADDHGWQFLDAEVPDVDQAAVLALSEVVALDHSILEIADLPPGWYAWRESKSSPWRRRERGEHGG